mmetsp:Transcript_36755/g.106006  ORF Transcript_36755/g.106006 Transcript_36755/m.106006 type:complete len:117 (-) Transcript_36755:43-393(-)
MRVTSNATQKRFEACQRREAGPHTNDHSEKWLAMPRIPVGRESASPPFHMNFGGGLVTSCAAAVFMSVMLIGWRTFQSPSLAPEGARRMEAVSTRRAEPQAALVTVDGGDSMSGSE